MVWIYVRELWRHSKLLLMSGSVSAVAVIYALVTGKSVVQRWGWVILAATFLAANFRVWRQEYHGTDARKRADRLAMFKLEGLVLNDSRYNDEGWVERVDAWAAETRAFLETCSQSALGVWDDTTGMKMPMFLGVLPAHQQQFGLLQRRLQNLAKIQDKPDVYLS